MSAEKNEERRKVLEMLAEGKVTAADADRLLEKLAATPSQENAVSNGARPRHLCVCIEKPGKTPTNVRVPLSFFQAGTKLGARFGVNMLAVLPAEARKEVEASGLNFAALGDFDWQSEDANRLYENFKVNVDHGNGKTVRVWCE